MVNALFFPSIEATEWLQDYLPGKSPAELPVAGRRLVDYLVECADLFKIGFSEVFDWHPSAELELDFSNPTRMAAPIFYRRGEGPMPRGLDDIARLSSRVARSEDDLVVIWGLSMPVHQPGDSSLIPLPEAECAETPVGQYQRRQGRWFRMKPRGFVVHDAQSWLLMNRAALNDPANFSLPGYSAENGVHLGRNVDMELGTRVKPPVILQDNSWCSRNVSLDGDVIIGSGAYVSEGARLSRTVVGDDTFIGAGLVLEDKIVIGRRVIDAHTGVWTDIEEPGVVNAIHGGPRWLFGLWKFLCGRSHGRFG